jgi:hypothetical protein
MAPFLPRDGIVCMLEEIGAARMDEGNGNGQHLALAIG